jgi:hypothetical protein
MFKEYCIPISFWVKFDFINFQIKYFKDIFKLLQNK